MRVCMTTSRLTVQEKGTIRRYLESILANANVALMLLTHAPCIQKNGQP